MSSCLKNVRHVGAEVLARVDDDFFDIIVRLDRVADSGSFDELRARAEDAEGFHVIIARTIFS